MLKKILIFMFILISHSVLAANNKLQHIDANQYYNIKTLEQVDMSKFDPRIPYEDVYKGEDILRGQNKSNNIKRKQPTHFPGTNVRIKKDTSKTCVCDDPEKEIPRNAFIYSVSFVDSTSMARKPSGDNRYSARWELPKGDDYSMQYHCANWGLRDIPVPAKYKIKRIILNSPKCGCKFYERMPHGKYRCAKWNDRYVLEKKGTKCTMYMIPSPSYRNVSRLPQCVEWN